MSNVYLDSYNTARADAYGRYCKAALENNSLSKSDICKLTGLRKSMIDDIEKSYNVSNPKSKTTTNYRRKLSNEKIIDRTLKSAKTRAINLQISALLKEINKGVNVLRNTDEINNLRTSLHTDNNTVVSGFDKTSNKKNKGNLLKKSAGNKFQEIADDLAQVIKDEETKYQADKILPVNPKNERSHFVETTLQQYK